MHNACCRNTGRAGLGNVYSPLPAFIRVRKLVATVVVLVVRSRFGTRCWDNYNRWSSPRYSRHVESSTRTISWRTIRFCSVPSLQKCSLSLNSVPLITHGLKHGKFEDRAIHLDSEENKLRDDNGSLYTRSCRASDKVYARLHNFTRTSSDNRFDGNVTDEWEGKDLCKPTRTIKISFSLGRDTSSSRNDDHQRKSPVIRSASRH